MTQYLLTKAYDNLFRTLADQTRFRSYSVAEFYCDRRGKPDPEKINIVLRIDVDYGFHLVVPLAQSLKAYGLKASFYFLTNPERYYRIWGSGIPKQVAALGFEVGLHSDHYYEQLSLGIDGLAKFKADAEQLSQEAGCRVRGSVYHGHPDMNAMGKSNWDLTKEIDSQTLGLDYHDGLKSCYIAPGAKTWRPKCDHRISDFLGFPNSWGWNYYPAYPVIQLRQAKPGQVVHIAFHSNSPHRYWHYPNASFGEKPLSRESALSFYYKAAIIRLKYGLLKNQPIKPLLLKAGLNILSRLLANGVGRFWPKPSEPEPDRSWETGRERIYALGIDYWQQQLALLGMTAPNGKVLEIGSGNGQWLLAYAHHARQVIGIEPGEAIAHYALERIAHHPETADKIRLQLGKAEQLPFPDNYFDRVLCAGVFMFTQQDAALKEMSRVLKPGGKLALTVNGLGYFIMHLLNGLRYQSVSKARYGLNGLTATLLKWWTNKEIDGPKAVNHNQMEAWLAHHNLALKDTHIYLPEPLYPEEHFGFVTNYAFIATKTVD